MNSSWKVFTKKSGSRFGAYKDRMVIIVTEAKSGFIYLPPKVVSVLGNPKLVNIMTRGSNVGIMPTESSTGYKIQHRDDGNTPYIAASQFCKSHNMRPGVYDVHLESGNIVVFDSQGSLSIL